MDEKSGEEELSSMDNEHEDMFAELNSISENQSDIFDGLDFLNEEKKIVLKKLIK